MTYAISESKSRHNRAEVNHLAIVGLSVVFTCVTVLFVSIVAVFLLAAYSPIPRNILGAIIGSIAVGCALPVLLTAIATKGVYDNE